ncbi:nicotinamide riboside transporter PnuC [Paenibacillus glycanilyticus]|uniref:nicotinamide riboside transporter PnuC n=1 Tax=Paenibacillus glycanilyticus TaxID=126569 RepID=UPI00203A5DBA|nr:nicotinamide riboside transporter PnuC [Paenibacillus glycanilyticus]MCM3631155.1 nicotinamide riboside transporter PnuC [Paenibacillus glycanilyticus]
MKQNRSMLGLLAAILAVVYFTSSSAIEIAATTTGLAAVWLTAKEKLWTWPISLVNVACFFYMFLDVKLYADMTLQVFFFVLSIYGWAVWMTKRGGAAVRPTRVWTPRMAVLLIVFLIVFTLAWGYLLERHTDASIPYLDAFIATLSLVAQFLLSYKILQSWYFWIVVDVLSIGMYFYKGLYTTSFLYVIFLGIAIMGLVEWKREYNRRASDPRTQRDEVNTYAG